MSATHRREFRLDVIRKESPVILTWSGVVVLFFAVLNFVVPPRGDVLDDALTMLAGALFIAVGALLRLPRFPAVARPWMVTAMVVLLVYLLLFQYYIDPRAVNLLWVIGVMLAFMPAVDDVPAALVGAGLTLAGLVAALVMWDVPDAGDFVMVALASLVIGGVLLHRRLGTLDALADAQWAALQGASTDPLTGVLNRRGLTEHLEDLAAAARRSQQDVFAVFVDVRGLKVANDLHGHDFGDEIIRAVARAIEASAREVDVVARWDGDEFVIVGIGAAPSPEEVESRVHAHVVGAGADVSKWSGEVTAGVASGSSDSDELAAVISRADQAMYRRRDGVR